MSADAHGKFSGKRLVIFGAGYVGSEIAQQALARGMQVTCLTRNTAKAEALRALGMKIVVADLAGTDWHSQVEGGAEFGLNCVSSGGGGISGYERSYLGGMKSILAWTRERGPVGTLVYTGSTSVYPQGDGKIVDELAPTDEVGERAKILEQTENLVRSGAGTRWFILRLAGIYGPERHHLLEQVRAGSIAGRGEHRLNLIHRDDICAAIWAVFSAPAEIKNEIFNVADDGAATKSEITAWLAARLGLPAPHFTGEPAAGRRVITPDRVIANAKLKRVLGWQPAFPSFREGYAAILRA
jgi:nucleoside-diphosphate-sugar epimerase